MKFHLLWALTAQIKWLALIQTGLLGIKKIVTSTLLMCAAILGLMLEILWAQNLRLQKKAVEVEQDLIQPATT